MGVAGAAAIPGQELCPAVMCEHRNSVPSSLLWVLLGQPPRTPPQHHPCSLCDGCQHFATRRRSSRGTLTPSIFIGGRPRSTGGINGHGALPAEPSRVDLAPALRPLMVRMTPRATRPHRLEGSHETGAGDHLTRASDESAVQGLSVAFNSKEFTLW